MGQAEADRRKAMAESPGPERVMCAAIWIDDGQEYAFQADRPSGLVFCGHSHGQALEHAAMLLPNWPLLRRKGRYSQGFLTTRNRYLTREESIEVAVRAGQIPEDFSGTLTSEDLW